MKKILIAILIFNFGLFSSANAFELFKKSPKQEIRTLLNQHKKAMEEHNIEKIKTFYDKDYKSFDGFNLDDLTSMLEKTYNAYGNIKYKTKINNISAYDNWAIAQMSDNTSAQVYPIETRDLKKEKMGILEGKSNYVVYLKKENNSWKIISDEILMEETSLKYGVANDIKMNLITPMFVKSGEEYDLSLKIDKPEDIVALASISREEITYPPLDYKEKFRKIPESGDLERLVRANDKNLDEYAVASIGFTKVSLNEKMTKAKIEVLGMAYLMKRINIDKIKEKSAQITELN